MTTEYDRYLSKKIKIEAIKNKEMRKEYRYMFFTQFFDTELYDKLRKDFIDKYGFVGLVGCDKLYRSIYDKTKRIKHRMSLIVEDAFYGSHGLYFVTFTFSDKYLNSTLQSYRRKLVQRLLKEYSIHYIANIDFGNDDRFTHREHYHAFISTDKINDLKKEFYRITESYFYIEKFRVNYSKSKTRLTKYVVKLGNHALKDSTKNNYLIYDRNNIYDIKELHD